MTLTFDLLTSISLAVDYLLVISSNPDDRVKKNSHSRSLGIKWTSLSETEGTHILTIMVANSLTAPANNNAIEKDLRQLHTARNIA